MSFFPGLAGVPVGRFYSQHQQRGGVPMSVVAVADDLLYKVECALRFPKRSRASVKITSPILSSDKERFNNKRLSAILSTSTYFSETWHTLVVSPHGDRNTIAEWENVRTTVRKRRCYSRYHGDNGVVMKPFRGYEVTVVLRRMRLFSNE